MAAVDDLNAAVAKVKDAVTAAVALIEQLRSGQGTPNAAVETAVADLNSASTALDAAVTPAPAPPPAPTPAPTP